jgi:hypothetical protein
MKFQENLPAIEGKLESSVRTGASLCNSIVVGHVSRGDARPEEGTNGIDEIGAASFVRAVGGTG